jgi:hypothetical protein
VCMHGQGNIQGSATQSNQSAEAQGQRAAQGAQGQAQPSGGQSSSKVVGDLSSIPANMLSLFQQFLATVGNKEEAGKTHVPEVNDAKIEQTRESEKAKIETSVPVKEIAESAQGEVRGITQNSRPYCYRCLTGGHPKEDCFVTLFL